VSGNRERRASRLASRPKVEELRRAEGLDRALALAGLIIALVVALTALLWGQRTAALAGSEVTGARLMIPTLGFAGGLVAALVGGVVLVFGWPLYRVTVILVGLCLGGAAAGALGWVAGGHTGAIIGGVLGGGVGAVAAWPAEVLVRTLSGAVLGMSLGMAVGSWTGSSAAMIVAALGGLLLGGGLTFLFYRTLIMVYSAAFGALAAVYGALSVWRPVSEVEPRPALLGATAALAVVGLFIQRSIERSSEQDGD